MANINDLPAEIHLMIIQNLSLEDLINYAGANPEHQAFFHENRDSIWRALYLRDVSSEPLPSGDAYREAYLKWKYPPLYDQFLAWVDSWLQMDEDSFERNLERYWRIVQHYHAVSAFQASATDEKQDLIAFIRTLGIQTELDDIRNLEAVRRFIDHKSYLKAQEILDIWKDADPEGALFRCSFNSRWSFFGAHITVLPKDSWLNLMRETNASKLMSSDVLYDIDIDDGVRFCKDGNHAYSLIRSIIRDVSY